MSTLEQLRQFTTIVADTGDFNVLREYTPQDGTTNPSHILHAAKLPQYRTIIEQAAKYGQSKSQDPILQAEHALLRLLVGFGNEILHAIPGRVSTEVDPVHSFDTAKTVEMARSIIDLYRETGVSKERVLIKIASTWEGFQACKILESEGIYCNMTLLFSPVQAKLAVENRFPERDYIGIKDPGVQLVTEIHNYYKENSIKTEIMAASLCSFDECIQLAGVQLMTINVKLLEELKHASYPVCRHLADRKAMNPIPSMRNSNEACFRFDMFSDRMASEKMAESLRLFLDDGQELKRILLEALSA
ncbi:uncharacterized protein PG998_014541 [Apiospora kogelbergensis]|uniref:uncharacterized protein n=1 Tax=Apiospora kogelbergensis TaxID=1337665 RepID=UPI0031300CC9